MLLKLSCQHGKYLEIRPEKDFFPQWKCLRISGHGDNLKADQTVSFIMSLNSLQVMQPLIVRTPGGLNTQPLLKYRCMIM